MKLDKRFALVAVLVAGLGFAATSCGDDSDDNGGNDEKKDECTITCDGANQEKAESDCSCVCKEGFYDENKGEEGKDLSCVAKQEKPDTCGNKKWDEGEICDVDESGNAVFEAGKEKSCSDWASENEETGTFDGLPGCNSTCQALAKGTCKVNSCGNGAFDEGETCDVIDGKVYVSDGNGGKREAVCTDWQEGTETMTGVPECNDKCSGIKKGTCAEPDEGIEDTCTAEVTFDEATKKATATVTASNTEAKTAVLCVAKNSKLEALIGSDKEIIASNEFDASSLTDAGEYVCYVVYMDKDNNRSFCSKDGAIIKLADATADNAGIATFTVESTVEASVIAKWTFANYSNKAADTNAIATVLPNGIAPEEGSDKDLKLKWEAVGDGATSIQIKMTQDNSGTNGSLTALQLTTSGATGKYGDGQKADAASHLSISDLSAYAVSSVKMTVKYEGGKVYITEVTDTEEKVVKEISGEASYAEAEATGFTAKAKNINIYADNTAAKAISIDDITVSGTK